MKQSNTKDKLSVICALLIIIFTVWSVGDMYLHVGSGNMQVSRAVVFRYFNVDSNILSAVSVLLLLICTVKYFPYASKAGSSTMIQISSELEEAASINGAGFLRRLIRIIFPIAKNGFMSGFILTFISIAKEFDLISLVMNDKTTTLSYLTFTYTSMSIYPLAAASSLVMIALISLCYLIAKYVFKADMVKSLG